MKSRILLFSKLTQHVKNNQHFTTGMMESNTCIETNFWRHSPQPPTKEKKNTVVLNVHKYQTPLTLTSYSFSTFSTDNLKTVHSFFMDQIIVIKKISFHKNSGHALVKADGFQQYQNRVINQLVSLHNIFISSSTG